MPTVLLVLCDIALVLAVARLLRTALERVRQPPVMGEVLAGIVLGASVLGALPRDPSAALFTAGARDVLQTLGEIGLVGYVLRVTARLDLGALRREGRAVGLVAVASFVVPFVAGGGLALALHGGVASDPPLIPFVVFIATAFGVTAFPVLARIVDDRGLGELPAGRVALAASAGQELLVWPMLAVAVALGGHTGDAPGSVLGLGAAAIAGAVVLGRLAVPAVVRALPAGGGDGVAGGGGPLAGGRGAAGIVVLAGAGLAAAATGAAGLHLIVGTFAYGVALPGGVRSRALAVLDTRWALAASAVLLPLFFAVPALRVDVGALGAGGAVVLVAVLAVAATAKLVSAAVAARLAGLSRRDAGAVGALMNARGLVELVVLGVGLDAGLIDAELFTVMVLMALITTLAAGPLVDAVSRSGRPAPAAARARPAAPR